MSELQVRRLPVLNREKRLVGIVSLGDLARQRAQTRRRRAERHFAADAYSQCRPGGHHAGQGDDPASESGTPPKARRRPTQAGEFVREEIHHIREGKHGARSAKQAIAIGLSKAARPVSRCPRTRREGNRARWPGKRVREQRNVGDAITRHAFRAEEGTQVRGVAHRPGAPSPQERDQARSCRSLHAAAMKAVATKGSAGAAQGGEKSGRDAEACALRR